MCTIAPPLICKPLSLQVRVQETVNALEQEEILGLSDVSIKLALLGYAPAARDLD